MNKLTKKIFDKNTVDVFDIKEMNWSDSDGRNKESAYTGKAIDRLAEYEDIGLTPEEIKTFFTDFGISVTIKNQKLKYQHEEDKKIIEKMAERIKKFEERYFDD